MPPHLPHPLRSPLLSIVYLYLSHGGKLSGSREEQVLPDFGGVVSKGCSIDNVIQYILNV